MKYFVTIEFMSRKVGWIVYPFRTESNAVKFVEVNFSQFQYFRYDIDALPKHWVKDYFYYEFSGEDYLVGDSLSYIIMMDSSDGELSMTVIKSSLPFDPGHFITQRSQEAIYLIERN